MARKRFNKEFYKSDVWIHWRNVLLEWNGNKCKHCGSKDSLHIHHKNYNSFGGDELPFDLIVLCKNCHSELHALVKKVMRGEVWL